MSINKYDRTWAQINRVKVRNLNAKRGIPVLYVYNRPSVFKRVVKTLKLYLSTAYSWNTSWRVAAR